MTLDSNNLAGFLWVVGPLDILQAAPDTAFKIAYNDRRGIDFGLQKEIIQGRWEGTSFIFTGLSEASRELLQLLFGEVAVRRAVEEAFPTRTSFHVKSALRFAKTKKPTPPAS